MKNSPLVKIDGDQWKVVHQIIKRDSVVISPALSLIHDNEL